MTIIDLNGKSQLLDKKKINDLLEEHGFVWIKNSGIRSAEEFHFHQNDIIDIPMDYLSGGAIRKKVIGHTLTPNVFPENLKIELHQELAYAKTYPRRIAFFCQSPAKTGGESILADIKKVEESLPEDLRNKIFTLKSCVTRFYFDEEIVATDPMLKSLPRWQNAFLSKDKAKIERIVKEQGYEYSWFPPNILQTKSCFDNYVYIKKIKYFFSSLVEISRATEVSTSEEILKKFKFLEKCGYFWQDGTPVSNFEIREITQAYLDNEKSFPLKSSDIIVVDNIKFSHGRLPYTGDRKFFVLLGNPVKR